MDTLVSDLPQSIVEMTLSSDSQESPEDCAVEEEDCKPTFEGSPSPEESCDDQKCVLKYACMARIGLGREFYAMVVEAMEGD